MKLKSYVNCEPEFFENTEYICAFEPGKQISWALPHYDAWHSCKYYSTDEFRGPNGIHVMRFAGPWVKQAFDETAHALKAHAEKMHNGS